MCWGDWTELQYPSGSVYDLRLNLRVQLDALHVAPCMRPNWEEAQMVHEVFLCVGSTCDSAFFGIPIVLLAQRWPVDMGVLLASEQYIPFFSQFASS